MRIAFMSPATAVLRASGFPKIHEVFEDTTEFWVGYPLTTSPVPHRPTLYLRERCRLAEVFHEMHDLILGEKQNDMEIHDFAGAVDLLSAQMHRWYQSLPHELHYEWPMSVAVWELQSVSG